MSATCQACGSVRPMGEMHPARDMFWRVLEGLWNCRDQEACFAAVLESIRRDRRERAQ